MTRRQEVITLCGTGVVCLGMALMLAYLFFNEVMADTAANVATDPAVYILAAAAFWSAYTGLLLLILPFFRTR